MAMKRCPDCGERYSDTYKNCPFCEEDALWQDEEERPSRGGRRGGRGQINLMTPTLIVLIVLMAGVLVWLLYGDKLAGRFGRDADDAPGVSDVTPQEPTPSGNGDDTPPAEGDGTAGGEDGSGDMPEGPAAGADGASGGAGNPDAVGTGGTTGGSSGTAGGSAGGSNSYAALAQLPGGLTLSNPDFTRDVSEGTYRLRVSGGSGTYAWVSENPAIATVDSNGVVTPVSSGNVNIVVSDGSKKAIGIVRVKGSGTPASGGSTAPANSGGSSGSAKLNKEDITISVGEKATLSVSGVTTSLTWAVGNSSVATVTGGGVVTGVSKGQTTVTVSWDGQSRSCIVRVK